MAYGLPLLLCRLWWVLSVQENWQGRRYNAACFPPCLLCLCWLELLPVGAWRSSFGSLLAFSAMETSQHRGWEGVSPLAGTGTAFLITSVSLSLYHAKWMINVSGMCCLGSGEHFQAGCSGEPTPQSFSVFAACILKQPPKEGLSCTGIYTCKLNCLILKWKLEATHVYIPFFTGFCF